MLDREVLTIRLRELLGAEEGHGPSREDLEARLAETGRKIDRLVDALAAGADNLPSVRTRLAELERERGSFEAQLAQARSRTTSTPNEFEATVDTIVDALQRFPEVLAAGEPEERKAVVRAFLQEIKIEKTKRQAVLRRHRLPRVDEPKDGGAEGARTPDPKTASLVLSQLSYSPMRFEEYRPSGKLSRFAHTCVSPPSLDALHSR